MESSIISIRLRPTATAGRRETDSATLIAHKTLECVERRHDEHAMKWCRSSLEISRARAALRLSDTMQFQVDKRRPWPTEFLMRRDHCICDSLILRAALLPRAVMPPSP